MAEDSSGAEMNDSTDAGFPGRPQNGPCPLPVDLEKITLADSRRAESRGQMKKHIDSLKRAFQEIKIPDVAGDGFDIPRPG
jgi:hypothetical protein